jgi:hypothetical protein
VMCRPAAVDMTGDVVSATLAGHWRWVKRRY